MYGFLLNMFIMRKIDADYLSVMVTKKYITADEKEMILATPQTQE